MTTSPDCSAQLKQIREPAAALKVSLESVRHGARANGVDVDKVRKAEACLFEALKHAEEAFGADPS